jgi:hypothetical protein
VQQFVDASSKELHFGHPVNPQTVQRRRHAPLRLEPGLPLRAHADQVPRGGTRLPETEAGGASCSRPGAGRDHLGATSSGR